MINYFKLNHLSLNKVLNSLFKQKIIRMTYLGIYKLKKMPEYTFNLLKFNIVLEDFTNYTIFVKLIDKYKIKESLYCYWFFCEENYSINTKFFAPKSSVLNDKYNGYEKRYEFQLLNKKRKIWKSSFVDIIDLKEYCRDNLNEIDDAIVKKVQKFLFVGVL